MGFIFAAHKIINDIETLKLEKKLEKKLEIKYESPEFKLEFEPELKPQKINTIEELSPRMKKRVKSMDNFMKFQWSWTL